jgi:fumarylpyruvate hydrolase
MTRRDLQNEMKKQGRPWCIGKAFDQSAPIGPLHPIAARENLTAGAISCDGQRAAQRQKGDLAELIWNVRDHRTPVSGLDTAARRPDLHRHAGRRGRGGAGDVMEGSIAGLGRLRVTIG